MTLSMRTFGKELEALTYQDLQTYFATEKVETDTLEFKSINTAGTLDEKIKGLARSVCAFLNSAGGILIWGAPSGAAPAGGSGPKRFSGALTPYNTAIEKDSLINRVTDRIVPIPNRIRLQICQENGNYVFVFEIQPSEYSPHQTDNTYYMRIDGQTRISPHHYIEAQFKKIKYPEVCIYFKIINASIIQTGQYRVDFQLFVINWSPLQNDEDISLRVFGKDIFFPRSQQAGLSEFYRMSGKEYFRDPIQRILHFGQPIVDPNSFIVEARVLADNPLVEVTVFISGRYSPTKKSEYTIDFRRINNQNKNEMIVEKSENIAIADWQLERGVTREAILRELLQ